MRTKVFSISLSNQDRFLEYSSEQHPIVLQIGGSDLGGLAEAAKLAQTYSYDEINLKYTSSFLNFHFMFS